VTTGIAGVLATVCRQHICHAGQTSDTGNCAAITTISSLLDPFGSV